MHERLVATLGTALAVAGLPLIVWAQEAAPSTPVAPQPGTVTRQDLPRVRIDDASGASHGRVSGATKARRPELRAYTFLSSTPGSYARDTRISDRFFYVEHLEQGPQYVTFRGGLRVALGK